MKLYLLGYYSKTVPYNDYPNQTRRGRAIRRITGYDHPIKKASDFLSSNLRKSDVRISGAGNPYVT
jgi:hypothetical protein